MNEKPPEPAQCGCSDTAKYPEAKEGLVGGVVECQIVRTLRVARLYNLGDYEHERIEVTVDVPFNVPPSDLLIRIERILEVIGEECPINDYTYGVAQSKAEQTDQDFINYYGDTWQEEKEKVRAQLADLTKQREAWKQRQLLARRSLDYLRHPSLIDDKLPWEK